MIDLESENHLKKPRESGRNELVGLGSIGVGSVLNPHGDEQKDLELQREDPYP